MNTYIVTGLVVGSVYAIASLGLVLTYTSTRIFNFAQGAIAFFLAITFYELTVDHGWNPQLAGVLTDRSSSRRCSACCCGPSCSAGSPTHHPRCGWCRRSGSGSRCRR